MSIVALDSHYILERIRSIAFSVGANFGDDGQFYRQKRAKQISTLLDESKLSDIIPTIISAIIDGEQDNVRLDSMHFYELLRVSRQFYTQQVLDAIQQEQERPRASFMILRRRVLDLQSTIDQMGFLRIDFHVLNERYPIRVSYKVESNDFLLNQWLEWFGTTKEEAILARGDFSEDVKQRIRGRSLCFLKYFHEYRNDRPIFWTYNRLHIHRDALEEVFHQDVKNGFVSQYQPHLWQREQFPVVQTFLRREGCAEKIFCKVGRHTFVLDSSISERDIFISVQVGKNERIQGILNDDGLSLRTQEHFVPIRQLLQRLNANPLSELARLGRESHLCAICGRKLDSHTSIERGMGPVCAMKVQPKPVQQPLFR